MGHVQMLGKVNKDMMAMDAPKFAPGKALEDLANNLIHETYSES